MPTDMFDLRRIWRFRRRRCYVSPINLKIFYLSPSREVCRYHKVTRDATSQFGKEILTNEQTLILNFCISTRIFFLQVALKNSKPLFLECIITIYKIKCANKTAVDYIIYCLSLFLSLYNTYFDNPIFKITNKICSRELRLWSKSVCQLTITRSKLKGKQCGRLLFGSAESAIVRNV